MTEHSNVRTGEATRFRRLVVAGPWIAILCIIAAVQLLRAVPLDAVIFASAAALLALDALRMLPSAAVRPRLRAAALLPIVVTAAVVLVLAPRHGPAAGAAITAIGVLIAPIGWMRPPPRPRRMSDRRPLRRAAIGWAAAAIAFCLLEFISYLFARADEASMYAHPAISVLLDPMLDDVLGRSVFIIAWLAAGVGLLTRGGRL